MPGLKENILGMEPEVVLEWLDGYALKAKVDCTLFDSSMNHVPGVLIVGKRKPSLIIEKMKNVLRNICKTLKF